MLVFQSLRFLVKAIFGCKVFFKFFVEYYNFLKTIVLYKKMLLYRQFKKLCNILLFMLSAFNRLLYRYTGI
jgi:hypothetical protein